MAAVAAAVVLLVLTAAGASGAAGFLGRFHHVRVVASTVPANGDVNPYGTVVVQRSVGRLVAGNVLVSNFNNGANLQGTGTTIVQISPSGRRTVFALLSSSMLPGRCPGGVGLTTALAVLRHGWGSSAACPRRTAWPPQPAQGA
jgi:hypothetical protein